MKTFSPITLLGLTTAALAETIDVKVGNGGLNFNPDSFTANVGDTVRFQFYGGFGSHSVALSSFDTPCQPASNGFYSGIIQGNQEGDHTFTITINSTDPSWIYCSVGSHCQSGMVAVINPPSSSSQNVAAYASAAQNVLRQTPPGAVQGGILATGGGGGGSAAPSTTASGLTPASPRPSLTASSGESQTVGSSVAVTTGGSSSAPASTTSGSSSRTGAGAGTTTAPSGSGAPASTSPSVAATTTSGGRKSEWSVVLGLSVVLGGLVALMA